MGGSFGCCGCDDFAWFGVLACGFGSTGLVAAGGWLTCFLFGFVLAVGCLWLMVCCWCLVWHAVVVCGLLC